MIQDDLSSQIKAEKQGEKLIDIEEFIARAKNLGVDFGEGDPKNRLRYYVKIGLLPHAQRKSFNGLPPNGAYPEKVLGILLEIDKKLKTGKSIQEIKREKTKEKKETEKKDIFHEPPIFYQPSETFAQKFTPGLLKTKLTFPPIFKKVFFIFLIVFSLGNLFLFSTNPVKNFLFAKLDQIDGEKFLASLFRLAQSPPDLVPDLAADREVLSSFFIEPYLTINAETVINASLKVKEKVTAPSFALIRDEFEGIINVGNLTVEREYVFPDLSGTICLTTGNCFGLAGEVISPGGTPNRLAKFISERELRDSSISDLYLGGVALTIDSQGNVGMGTLSPRARLEVAGNLIADGNLIASGRVGVGGIEDPLYSLHVQGAIQATGDICTDLAGGRCLSTLPIGGGGGARGVGGSGSVGYLPIWSDATTLSNSILYQLGSNIGIGTTLPSQRLDVDGTIRMLGFQLPTNATSGYVLTADEFGFGTWMPLSEATLPSGLFGQTLRHNGGNWLADSFLYNTGSALGIGTTSSLATLTVAGDGYFSGPLAISTLGPYQLILNYDENNYLRFSVDGSQSEIYAQNMLVLDSLTGTIGMGGNVTLLDASSAEVRGQTFISAADDGTVRKQGELIFRSSVPVFKFPVPAQTTSTVPVIISRAISTSTLNAALPSSLAGTTRQFAFLLNFADNISSSASSTWLIDPEVGSDIEFSFAGQEMLPEEFEQGNAFMSQLFSPPEENWDLKVNVPVGSAIRVFNIFLLVYDRVND